MDSRVAEIQNILALLARAESLDTDSKEVVYDREARRVRNMDRTDILAIVETAVGENVKRRRYASFVYSELYDVPGIENVFLQLLKMPTVALTSSRQ